MKKKILNISSEIAIFSFIVMIALLISLIFPFDAETIALLMLLDLAAGFIFAVSLSIILVIGISNFDWGGDHD